MAKIILRALCSPLWYVQTLFCMYYKCINVNMLHTAAHPTIRAAWSLSYTVMVKLWFALWTLTWMHEPCFPGGMGERIEERQKTVSGSDHLLDDDDVRSQHFKASGEVEDVTPAEHQTQRHQHLLAGHLTGPQDTQEHHQHRIHDPAHTYRDRMVLQLRKLFCPLGIFSKKRKQFCIRAAKTSNTPQWWLYYFWAPV